MFGYLESSLSVLCCMSAHLDALGVLLVEGSDVEGVGRVDLPTWGDEGWGVLLQVHLLPLQALKERVLLQLTRTGGRETIR